MTGVGLEALSTIDKLEELILWTTDVNDEGLEVIGEIDSLTWLGLGATDVTDDGLAHLVDLKSLNRLDLFNTRVSYRGMVHLQRLTSLRELRLHDLNRDSERTDIPIPAVADEGVPFFGGLKSLQLLELSGTQLTPAGAARLHQVLPYCYIRASNNITYTPAPRPTAKGSGPIG